jgi:hypothetical protein
LWCGRVNEEQINHKGTILLYKSHHHSNFYVSSFRGNDKKILHPFKIKINLFPPSRTDEMIKIAQIHKNT